MKPAGFPGGFLEATRRSFNKDFLLALAADFKKHGAAAIEKVRKSSTAISHAGRRRLGAGVGHEAAARASRCACLCPRGGGGTFRIQIFIQTPSPEIWSEMISGSEEGP